MTSEHRTPAARRGPWRAGVAAWLRMETGDTLIEVMIAALLVALIATATFTGYTAVAHVSSGQRGRAQASALAEADQARLRGLTLDALAGTQGNVVNHYTIDGTTYTVTSSSTFVSGSGSSSCTSSGSSTADEVQTTSRSRGRRRATPEARSRSTVSSPLRRAGRSSRELRTRTPTPCRVRPFR